MSKEPPELSLDELKAIESEFSRLGDTVYLDHMGATLYAESQIKNVSETLQNSIFSNPHSNSATVDLVDQVRFKILDFFNTFDDQYHVIFTANATASLKLVAECFSFKSIAGNENEGNFYYCQDNHTSVLGMREIVNTKHQFMLTKEDLLANEFPAPPEVSSDFSSDDESDELMDDASDNLMVDASDHPSGNPSDVSSEYTYDSTWGNSLVVYPAQCNFSGYKFPLSIIHNIQYNGLKIHGLPLHSDEEGKNVTHKNNYYVLLDAAAYAGSSYLNLTKYKPDFVCVSFYKLFGYPTGVGALLVYIGAERVMKKKYYGGGTIDFAFTNSNTKRYRSVFYTRFEDGTLPFLSIAGLLEGFKTLERLVKPIGSSRSIKRISRHVFMLAKYCHKVLSDLRHDNGMPVVKFYNYCGYNDNASQGGIVTFNLLNDIGTYVGYGEVACIAALHKIILRTGCFCNLGACKSYLNLNDETVLEQFESGRVCGDYNDLINGVPSGAVRVSFGYMSKKEDVESLALMIRNYYCTVKVGVRLQLIEEFYTDLPTPLKVIHDDMQPKVLKLHIYPVKSCAAFKVDSWEISNDGFKFDRQWMIVDANGTAVTQKQNRRLCLIKPHIIIARNELQLEFEGFSNVIIPLEVENNSSIVRTSKVCRTPVCGVDCGDNVAMWINNCLQTTGLRLIHRENSNHKQTASFANHGQLLVLNVASVRYIAEKLPTLNEPIDTTIDRFRANIIIDSKNPFEENDFTAMYINYFRFRVDGPCRRCELVCINQHTGENSPEILRTIARELDGKITFGIYISTYLRLRPSKDDQTISCGGFVKIIRRELEN